MRYRLLAAVFAVCLAAMGQTLSVDELAKFLQSSVQLKMADREVANFLLKARLKERLDDRTIEELQGYGIGPKTLQALHALRDRSQQLAVAKPIVPEAKPVLPPSSSCRGARGS